MGKNMTFNFEIKITTIEKLKTRIEAICRGKFVVLLATVLATAFTTYFYFTDKIVAYGDAESHLNIAKRVIDSITPGAGQIGGVWLPLPHMLMIPFVANDFLWRSGLAGSIVSGAAFIISSFFIFRFIYLLTENRLATNFALSKSTSATEANIPFCASTRA